MCAVRPAIQDNQGEIYQSGFEYDDLLFLTYNDYILFSTTDEFINLLGNGSWSGKMYNWLYVQGSYAFNASVWEWGNTSFNDENGFELYAADGKMDNVNSLSIDNQTITGVGGHG